MEIKPRIEMPTVFDNTMLECYNVCPMKFMWEHGQHFKLKTPAMPLIFGAAIHAALEAWYTKHDLIPTIDAFLKGMKDAPTTDEKRNIVTGTLILEDYIKHYPSEPFKPIIQDTSNCELDFILPINDDFSYSGRIDMIADYPPYGLVFVDHKTTSQLGGSFFNMAKPNRQFSGYYYAMREHFDKVYGCIVNAILVAKTKTHFAREITTRTQYELDEWLEDTKKIVARIAHSVEHNEWIKYTHSCTYYGLCAYHTLCYQPRNWQEVSVPDTTYEVRVWNPLDRLEVV